MRNVDTLYSIEDVAIFYQYLYMDPDHRITFNNGITNLTLRMTDTLAVLCKNERFPDLPELSYSDNLTLYNLLALIEILNETPPVEFPSIFKNRWEEIKEITLANVANNKVRTERMNVSSRRLKF